MRLDQEIIDMENFYSTATIEEAFAFMRATTASAYTKIKTACKKAIKICKGILARFAKPHQFTDQQMDYQIWVNNWSTSPETRELLDNLEDEIQMETLYCEALSILNKANKK